MLLSVVIPVIRASRQSVAGSGKALPEHSTPQEGRACRMWYSSSQVEEMSWTENTRSKSSLAGFR